MNESRTKKSFKNILSGLFFRIIGMVFPFIIKTIIIWTLGAKYLGLNSLFSSILSMLSLSELGIGSALVYNMYKPLAENDNKLVCALLKAYKKYYRLIGLIILLFGIIILPFIPKLISGTYPNEVNIYILFTIYLLDSVISYWTSAYKCALLEANQKNGIENLLHSVTNRIMYTLQIIVLILTKNYYLYLFMMPGCTLLLNFIRSKLVDRLYPNIKCEGELDKNYIKKIFIKVRALIGHKIGTTMINSSDNIIISAFLGLEVLAIYGNYHMIVGSLISLVTIFYTAITASIGNSLIVDSKEKSLKIFNVLNFINFWLVSWCTICLVCLFQTFMEIWMGKEMMFPFYLVILFAIYFYTWLIRRIGLTYKDAAGMWEQDFWKPYIGAIVNLIINFIFVKFIGVQGVIIATIVVMGVIYFPWETFVLFKYIFKISPKQYLLKVFQYTITMVLICIFTYFISNLVQGSLIQKLLFKALICIILPNSIFIIIYYNTEEFIMLRNKILYLIRKEK